jgi:glycosyltransferase involved in cell wall biosynthesis
VRRPAGERGAFGPGGGHRDARRCAPRAARDWLSFPVDDRAVEAIAERVVAWLQAEEELRARTRSALVAVARERYSWEGVARTVIGAARGELSQLDPVT